MVNRVSVTKDLEFDEDLACNLRYSIDIEGEGAIVRSENNIEEGGGEAGIVHASTQTVRLEHANCGHEREKDGEEKRQRSHY